MGVGFKMTHYGFFICKAVLISGKYIKAICCPCFIALQAPFRLYSLPHLMDRKPLSSNLL